MALLPRDMSIHFLLHGPLLLNKIQKLELWRVLTQVLELTL